MNNSAFIKLENCNLSGIDSISRIKSLRQKFISLGTKNDHTKSEIPILKNINLTFKTGDKVALVGNNGSGKSSLLKLISGIYPLKSGQMKINGSITPIIETGTGLELDFSGKENIKILMLYNNLLDKYSKELEEKIIDFSELEEKINQPVKTYSSGMIARLAFSISIFQHPDILLLDEVFATGDKNFIQKSLDFMNKKINSIPITILVSHQEEIIHKFCNRCILIKEGKVVMDDSPKKILSIYNQGNY